MKITSQKINNIAVDKIEYDFEGIKDYCYVEKGETDNYIVNFHGHGSNADQLYTREDIFQSWYPAIKKRRLGIINFDTQGNGWMNKDVIFVTNQILQFLKKEYNIQKLIFSGGSMGGTSALIYTIHHPEDADGVIANCPVANMTEYYHFLEKSQDLLLVEIRETIKERYKGTPEESSMYKDNNANEKSDIFTMPLYVCQATGDQIIPCEWTLDLINKLKGQPNFMYKIIDGGDHDSPLSHFEEELNWMCEKVFCKAK
ncbi:MAG: alpha/beta hydrolase [Abditibacteriota bacterium]|nr:alpha/beta hydrolase [Abditibacteriota bacterium]